MELVHTQSELDVQEQEDRAGHAEGETGHVDEGVDLIFCDVPPGDLPIVFKHSEL